MDDFETRLKRIPLAEPPVDLKKRIFGGGPKRFGILSFVRFRIPVGWAALFAIATGVLGMTATQWLGPAAESKIHRQTEIRLIESASNRNMFDFSGSEREFMPGKLTVNVESSGKV